MKNNTLRKVLSVGLVSAMTASMMVGCGSSSTDTAADTAADTSASETTEAADTADAGVAGMEGWTAFDDTVTLQIPVYDRGDNGNGCSDVVNNYWTNWVQENFGDKYNIDVEYVGITRSDVMTGYSLLAASQSLPTICMEYDYDKLATWATEGYLQPYDIDEFKQIAPTYWANMEANDLTGYTDFDGDHYIVLGQRPYGNTTYTYVTWYRQDWLEEAGFTEYPQTTSELIELYDKIQENHPDVYPAMLTKATGAGLDQNYSYRTYPQDELTWATTGDYQIPALSTEAQKNFLKLQNYFYNNGYLDPEYYMNEAADNESAFANGKAFTYTGYVSSTNDVLTAFYENNPDATLGVVKNSGEFTEDATWGTNNSYRPNNVFGAMAGFSSQADDDQIKAAMMYMEWMSQDDVLFTMTWGIEGVNFNYEDGTPVAVGDQSGLEEQQGHNNNVDYWMIVTASKSFGSIEEDVAAIAPTGLPQDFTQDIIDNYYGQVKLYEAGYANSDCLFGGAVEAVTEYSETLYSTYGELRDKLIQCSEDEFDSLYEQYSQQYLDAGYQAVIDDRTEIYNEGMTTKLQ